jgi:hypothetical protein
MYRDQQPSGLAYFEKRAGGHVPQRRLSAMVYPPLDSLPTGFSFRDFHELLESRLAQEYPIEAHSLVERSWALSTRYRFVHSGEPVIQTWVNVQARDGRIHFLEITGHEKDENLLLNDTRQIVADLERH